MPENQELFSFFLFTWLESKWKLIRLLALTLSCWPQNPFLFRGIFMSIFALTMVILDVTRQIWHRPERKITQFNDYRILQLLM